MSHCVDYRDYPEKCNRKQVKADLDYYVSMEDWQEGCSGLYRDIRWLESAGIMPDSEAAEEYIEQHDRGDYDNLAVRYYVTPPMAASKGTEKTLGSVNKAQISYNDLRKKVEEDFWNTKSEFVSCKECGSRLSKKQLGRLKKTNCPLCGKSLLSDTAEQRLASAKKRTLVAQKKYKEASKKDQAKAVKAEKNREVRWLLKFEYHT